MSSSKRPAGRISTTTCASASPVFHQSWAIPAGAITCRPGAAMATWRPSRTHTRPRTTVIRSSIEGWTCASQAVLPGGTYRSSTNNAPSLSSVPMRTTARSPVTAFSKTSPEPIILCSFRAIARHLPGTVGRPSMRASSSILFSTAQQGGDHIGPKSHPSYRPWAETAPGVLSIYPVWSARTTTATDRAPTLLLQLALVAVCEESSGKLRMQQAQCDLELQHVANRVVDGGHGDAMGDHGVLHVVHGPAYHRCHRGQQGHIGAGRDRTHGRLLVGLDPDGETTHRQAVGDDQALEAQLMADVAHDARREGGGSAGRIRAGMTLCVTMSASTP